MIHRVRRGAVLNLRVAIQCHPQRVLQLHIDRGPVLELVSHGPALIFIGWLQGRDGRVRGDRQPDFNRAGRRTSSRSIRQRHGPVRHHLILIHGPIAHDLDGLPFQVPQPGHRGCRRSAVGQAAVRVHVLPLQFDVILRGAVDGTPRDKPRLIVQQIHRGNDRHPGVGATEDSGQNNQSQNTTNQNQGSQKGTVNGTLNPNAQNVNMNMNVNVSGNGTQQNSSNTRPGANTNVNVGTTTNSTTQQTTTNGANVNVNVSGNGVNATVPGAATNVTVNGGTTTQNSSNTTVTTTTTTTTFPTVKQRSYSCVLQCLVPLFLVFHDVGTADIQSVYSVRIFTQEK